MTSVFLAKSNIQSGVSLILSGSKSITNRLLVLQQMYDFKLMNPSNSYDTQIMQRALQSTSDTIDIGHTGTAMRFLTAYFAFEPYREVILTGSERMKQRPIGILVQALKDLGADIQYLEKEGFPPLKIKGKKLEKNEVFIKSDVSSQYLTALLLVGNQLENGLILHRVGQTTSLPYLQMTLSVLNNLGISVKEKGQSIYLTRSKVSLPEVYNIESDWSSASYFYSFIALSPVGTQINLQYFFVDSLQGDSILPQIYALFGVKTTFLKNQISLCKQSDSVVSNFCFDFTSYPDIAQTVIVTCLGLQICASFSGLHTLRIKETDRLEALRKELTKLGAIVKIQGNTLDMKPKSIYKNQKIETYQDHRMAMAFAPLCLITDITIDDKEVVRKSYPNFWEDCKKIGVVMQ